MAPGEESMKYMITGRIVNELECPVCMTKNSFGYSHVLIAAVKTVQVSGVCAIYHLYKLGDTEQDEIENGQNQY